MTTNAQTKPQEAEKLDIVIPCYNPVMGWEKNFIVCAREIYAKLSHLEIHFIIVNDGSDVNFLDLQIIYLRKYIKKLTIVDLATNKGKGNAVRMGLHKASSPYVIYTDIDFPYTTDSIVNVWNKLKGGSDVVLGARSEQYYKNIPYQRQVVSKALKFLNNKILKLPVFDTQCGLKGMNIKGKDVLAKTKINQFLFDVEFVNSVVANKSLQLTTQEVTMRNNTRVFSISASTLFREFKNFLKILIKKIISKYVKSA